MKESIEKISDSSKFKGKLIEVIDRIFKLTKNNSTSDFTIEVARRPPGVRLIVISTDNKILLTKEYRSELEAWDYRIAGGKIFESFDEYIQYVDDEEYILKKSIEAIKNEGIEECGIIVKNQELYYKSKSGAIMEWDLYYYLITDFEISKNGNETEFAEIIHPEWFTFNEAINMCLDGRIKEDRSIGVLLKYFLSKEVLSVNL